MPFRIESNTPKGITSKGSVIYYVSSMKITLVFQTLFWVKNLEYRNQAWYYPLMLLYYWMISDKQCSTLIGPMVRGYNKRGGWITFIIRVWEVLSVFISWNISYPSKLYLNECSYEECKIYWWPGYISYVQTTVPSHLNNEVLHSWNVIFKIK